MAAAALIRAGEEVGFLAAQEHGTKGKGASARRNSSVATIAVDVATPKLADTREIQKLCASGQLLWRRIAGHFEREGAHFRGTVISCEIKGSRFIVRYDDADELWQDARSSKLRFLSPPASGGRAEAPSYEPEFDEGFEIEYRCVAEHGEEHT